MSARLCLLLCLTLAGPVLLDGCSEEASKRPSASTSTRAPDLGGRPPTPRTPPSSPMNDLEKQIAGRLAAHVLRQGLVLEHLDCPHWDGAVPSRMTCRGYVDGVVATVRVHLASAVDGKAVNFDARLQGGVIATQNLVDTLQEQGWSDADCGAVPAYPARVGSRIVCRVTRDGADQHVVATVRDRSGAVMIRGY